MYSGSRMPAACRHLHCGSPCYSLRALGSSHAALLLTLAQPVTLAEATGLRCLGKSGEQ